jgi:hypothetical protein
MSGAGDTDRPNGPLADDDEALASATGRTVGEPDVLLDVPQLRVDEISLEVENLQARVSLEADVLDLLRLHVGVDATLGRVQLTIKGVEAQVLLKAHLDNVARILDRVLTTIDNNPQIVERLTEHVGRGVERVAAGAGEAVGDLGAGTASAVQDLAGTIDAVAETLAEEVAHAAGTAAGDVAERRPAEQGKQRESKQRSPARRSSTPAARAGKTKRAERRPRTTEDR